MNRAHGEEDEEEDAGYATPDSAAGGHLSLDDDAIILSDEELVLDDDDGASSPPPTRTEDDAAATTPQIPPPRPKTHPLRRYLRSWGSKADQPSFTLVEEEEEEGEDSSSDGSIEFEDYSFRPLFEHQVILQTPVSWDDMPILPTNFVTATTNDPPIRMTQTRANQFVWEQALLVRAVLQLTAEREQIGVEGDTESSDNIWKKGPLKKLSLGNWKVKYVELRRGNLCYYEDSDHSGRKILHLRVDDTIVQSRTDLKGFCFEVVVPGTPARVWMARSEEERQSWMKAIVSACIGRDDDPRDLDLAPHHEALEVYTTVRENIAHVDTHDDYVQTIQHAMQDMATLQIPVQWVRELIPEEKTKLPHRSTERDAYKRLQTSINEFWKGLSTTSFSINNHLIASDSPYAAERTLGSLTRCIMEFDKAFADDDAEPDIALPSISELQAVSHARQILLTMLKSKEHRDAVKVVTHLLRHDELVDILPKSEEAIHLEVSFAGEDLPVDEDVLDSSELSGWVRTRRKNGNRWRRRFAVLSGAVISYYEAASPRPHGLRGQIVLGGATVHAVEEGTDTMALCVISADEERLFAFDDEATREQWKEAIQTAIDSCIVSTVPKTKRSILNQAERFVKGVATDASLRSGIRVIRSATGGGMRQSIKVIKTATGGGIRVIRSARRGAVGMLQRKSTDDAPFQRRPSMQMLMNTTTVLKREPTVQCVAQSTQEFQIMEHCKLPTAIPDRIMTVRAKLFQAFLLSGGPNGRLAKGDALVELEFLPKTLDGDNTTTLPLME